MSRTGWASSGSPLSQSSHQHQCIIYEHILEPSPQAPRADSSLLESQKGEFKERTFMLDQLDLSGPEVAGGSHIWSHGSYRWRIPGCLTMGIIIPWLASWVSLVLGGSSLGKTKSHQPRPTHVITGGHSYWQPKTCFSHESQNRFLLGKSSSSECSCHCFKSST
jgi:hypothetical protein